MILYYSNDEKIMGMYRLETQKSTWNVKYILVLWIKYHFYM